MERERSNVIALDLPRKLYTSCLSTKASRDEFLAAIRIVNECLDASEQPSLLSVYLQHVMNLLYGLDVGDSLLVSTSAAKLVQITNMVQENEHMFSRHSRL